MLGGTALIASLVATIIIGNISNARVNAPAKILFPKENTRTKISNPSNP